MPRVPTASEVSVGQKGRRIAAVSEIMKEPRRPACMPVEVTPPLVPGATLIHRRVMRRGLEVARMPSSEEKVSAATAA